MSDTIIVAIIAFSGTLLGTFGGILTSSKLTNYRIEQLEKKVDKHNNFAQRMPVVEENIKVINHRIKDLEKKEGNDFENIKGNHRKNCTACNFDN